MLTYGTAETMVVENTDADTVNNTYNRDILTAAKRLCEAGYSSWKYETHYSSGTTCWSNGDQHLMITRTGEITR